MFDIKEHQRIEKNLETLRRDKARAEGSLENHNKKLTDDFGCSSLKEGEAILIKMKKEQERLEKERSAALEKLEEKWGDKL